MGHSLFNVEAADMAEALILLSLDELAGSEAQMNAPALAARDRDHLRNWLAAAPGLGELPFNVDMADYLWVLNRSMSSND